MAIEITKIGQLPAKRKYTGKCATCKSEYRAEQGDLTYDSDFHESFYWTSCQLCENRVYFYPETK